MKFCFNSTHLFESMQNPLPSMTVKIKTTSHSGCGIGKVTFDIKNCNRIKTVHLKEGVYVPSTKRNLISMSKMGLAE